MLSKEQISVAFTNNSTIDLTYSFNGTIIATYNPQRQLEGTFGYGLGKGILSVYNSSMNYLKKTSIYSYFSSTTNQPKKVAIIKALTKKNLADLHILEKNIINSHKLNNVVASINKFYDTIPLFLRADVSAMKNFNSRIKKAIINRYSDNQQLSNFCLNLNEIAKTQLDLVYTGSQIDSYTKSEALLSGSIQELNKENLYTHINPTINEELLYQELSNFIRNEMNKNIRLSKILTSALLSFIFCNSVSAQGKNQMVRLANLVIDTAQLDSYKALLKEEIEASVRLEPGVLTLYAVFEKNNPTHITILEIYADESAYKSHLLTPHFIKYKNGTKDMVKFLELAESDPIVPGMKIK